MALSYIPLVLNADVLSDGENAQLLSITNFSSPIAAVALAANSTPRPYRKGKMSVRLLLQDSVGTTDADLGILLCIRSPFAGDTGLQSNRPSVLVTPANAASGATGLYWGGPPAGIPGAAGPAAAADFALTFNGKAIPNWTVLVQHADVAGPLGAYVEINFGASAAN